MDKKNTILGIICIAAGIGFMYKQTNDLKNQQLQQQQQEAAALERARVEAPVVDSSATNAGAAAGDDILDLLTQPQEVAAVVVAQPTRAAAEQVVTLSNDFIEVEFTTLGGAIRTVEFLQTKTGQARRLYLQYRRSSACPEP